MLRDSATRSRDNKLSYTCGHSGAETWPSHLAWTVQTYDGSAMCEFVGKEVQLSELSVVGVGLHQDWQLGSGGVVLVV